jgi:hypothetical protein
MRKLERSDVGIEFVRLLAEHSKSKGIADYTEAAIIEFGDAVELSLKASAKADHRVRGLRAESLFVSVVAGIGKVRLIKAEDCGDLYFTGDDVGVPDFRIVTEDANQLLVEVKVVPRDGTFNAQLKMSDTYVQRLVRYATHVGAELCFAIFWEGIGAWTLNRLKAFVPGSIGTQRWSIKYPRALATSEMALLGDCTVATRAPLRFRVLLDPDKSDPMPPGSLGKFTVTLKGLQLLSQERPLRGLAAQIAWRLLWYGGWDEVEQESHYEADRLLWVDHVIGPPGWDEEPPEADQPVFVASLSAMISNAYLRGAKHTIHSTTKGGVLEPGYMGNFIPSDFLSLKLDLPLYLFRFEPNYDFKETDHHSDGC